MLVRTSYVINVYDYTDEVNVVDFECRNLSEVKQIMSKVDNFSTIDGTNYKIRLYKVEVIWTLSTGVISQTKTQITADF